MSNKNKKVKKSNVSMVINEDVKQESKEYRENGGSEQGQDNKAEKRNDFSHKKESKKDNRQDNRKDNKTVEVSENKQEEQLVGNPIEGPVEKSRNEQEKKPVDNGTVTTDKDANAEKGQEIETGKPVARIKEDVKQDIASSDATAEEKQDKRPASISLKDKSEQFKKIIDVALAFEKVEIERNRLKRKNKELTEEKAELKREIEEVTVKFAEKQEEIDKLKADVEHRNEVINIVKADKTESAQEFKNALGASLKSFHTDFEELKAMEMSNDVGLAIVDTLENVFKVLEKNGITIK